MTPFTTPLIFPLMAQHLVTQSPNRIKHGRRTTLRDIVDMQELLVQSSKSPQVKPHDQAALVRAWCDLEETKRKIRMRPLPKSVDVSKFRNARKPSEVQATED